MASPCLRIEFGIFRFLLIVQQTMVCVADLYDAVYAYLLDTGAMQPEDKDQEQAALPFSVPVELYDENDAFIHPALDLHLVVPHLTGGVRVRGPLKEQDRMFRISEQKMAEIASFRQLREQPRAGPFPHLRASPRLADIVEKEEQQDITEDRSNELEITGASGEDGGKCFPPGFCLVEEIITPDEEKKLIDYLDDLNGTKWISRSASTRRTQQFGPVFNYNGGNSLSFNAEFPEIPNVFHPLLRKLSAIVDLGPNQFPFPYEANQIIVNEYRPGQGIAPHIDRPHLFDTCVASVSMLSDAAMTFEVARNTKVSDSHYSAFSVLLKRRSAVLLKDVMRYNYTHTIPPVAKETIFDSMSGHEVSIQRERRVSITVRRVLRGAMPAPPPKAACDSPRGISSREISDSEPMAVATAEIETGEQMCGGDSQPVGINEHTNVDVIDDIFCLFDSSRNGASKDKTALGLTVSPSVPQTLQSGEEQKERPERREGSKLDVTNYSELQVDPEMFEDLMAELGEGPQSDRNIALCTSWVMGESILLDVLTGQEWLCDREALSFTWKGGFKKLRVGDFYYYTGCVDDLTDFDGMSGRAVDIKPVKGDTAIYRAMMKHTLDGCLTEYSVRLCKMQRQRRRLQKEERGETDQKAPVKRPQSSSPPRSPQQKRAAISQPERVRFSNYNNQQRVRAATPPAHGRVRFSRYYVPQGAETHSPAFEKRDMHDQVSIISSKPASGEHSVETFHTPPSWL